jgi:CspA family cold shock protein
MQGSVKKIKRESGFGFVRPDDGASDVFFHFTGVVGGAPAFEALAEGQVVVFDIEQGKKGPQAINVQAGAAGAVAANDDSFEMAA